MLYFQIMWALNDRELQFSAPRIQLTETSSQSTLEVDDFSEEDAGEYSVTITNQYGQDHAVFAVIIKGKYTHGYITQNIGL